MSKSRYAAPRKEHPSPSRRLHNLHFIAGPRARDVLFDDGAILIRRRIDRYDRIAPEDIPIRCRAVPATLPLLRALAEVCKLIPLRIGRTAAKTVIL